MLKREKEIINAQLKSQRQQIVEDKNRNKEWVQQVEKNNEYGRC